MSAAPGTSISSISFSDIGRAILAATSSSGTPASEEGLERSSGGPELSRASRLLLRLEGLRPE
jgi:hypothetical protein